MDDLIAGLTPEQRRLLDEAGELIIGGRLVVAPQTAPTPEKPAKKDTRDKEGE